MNIKLTPRLMKIASLIQKGSKVADIGTDHGYIPIYLIQNNISKFIIAGDANPKPLQAAGKNIELYGCQNIVQLRLGNGLEILKPYEADTVIIAGLGGLLIAEMLKFASTELINSIQLFIFQPMQAQAELRKYLIHNNFKIIQDLLVKEEKHIYEIITAKTGKQKVEDELQYDIGFTIESNPYELAVEFIERKINEQENIISGLNKRKSDIASEKYKESMTKLKKLKEVLKCLKK